MNGAGKWIARLDEKDGDVDTFFWDRSEEMEMLESIMTDITMEAV